MNPLRRLTRALVVSSMRPPLAQQLVLHRPARDAVDLAGKRVLLTGASSGIGESAAAQFARLGAHVIAVARRENLLDDVVQGISDEGGSAVAFPCDLSDLDAVEGLVANVEEQFGGVDILVNNAARSIRRPLQESLERWHDVERTMQLNYFAPLRLIRGLAPGMLERGDGHVINVATWGVMSGSATLFGVYYASKAALSTVSRAIDSEWSHRGVHQTTLYYPLVKTPMIEPTKAYAGLPGLTADEAAEWMIAAARMRPVRIAPRIALWSQALDTMSPTVVKAMMKRRAVQPGG